MAISLTIFSYIKHHFIPHEGNNYRAKIIHPQYLVFYISVLLIFQFAFRLAATVNPDILGYATDITLEKLLLLINSEREKNNLLPLTLSQELSIAASRKAEDMFRQDYWAHISPTGTTPWKFITDSGYQYVYAGENLARNFDKTEDVVKAWMNSQTHRANILKPEYTDIGFAVMNGKLKGTETTLVVQEFGSKTDVVKAIDNNALSSVKILPTAIPQVKSASKVGFPYNYGREQKITDANKKSFAIAGYFTPKNISLLVAEMMLVVLFLDSLYMWKYNYPRIGGQTLAHLIFIITLIIAMGATGIGVVL